MKRSETKHREAERNIGQEILDTVLEIKAGGGRRFTVDDFKQQVAGLRSSQAFQRFLDQRSISKRRIPLEEIEREIEQELAAQQPG